MWLYLNFNHTFMKVFALRVYALVCMTTWDHLSQMVGNAILRKCQVVGTIVRNTVIWCVNRSLELSPPVQDMVVMKWAMPCFVCLTKCAWSYSGDCKSLYKDLQCLFVVDVGGCGCMGVFLYRVGVYVRYFCNVNLPTHNYIHI